MPCAPLLSRLSASAPSSMRPEAGEIMSGVLEIVSPKTVIGGHHVFVRVYRTSSEHFAVLYPLRSLVTARRPLCSLNLKSCTVERLNGGPSADCRRLDFRVAPRSCDGIAITFRVVEPSDADHRRQDEAPGGVGPSMDSWVSAFGSKEDTTNHRKLTDHRGLLPVLMEREEDEQQEHSI